VDTKEDADTKETANAKDNLDCGKSLLFELIKMTREQLSDEDLFGIYLTLFGAATLTTSRLLSIRLCLLTHYPHAK